MGGCLAAALAVLFLATVLSLVATTLPARASTAPEYAYATATTSGLATCPQTSVASQECTLAEALSLVAPGGAVALATPGSTAHYVGNWAVGTSGTSSSEPVTIGPAAGVANPVLDGNNGSATGCQTPVCSGAVLTIASQVYAAVGGVTFQGADHSAGNGGAIDDEGFLTVSASTFSANAASDGGAIYNGFGDLTVSASTFSANTASTVGGAIANSDSLAYVSGSTFSANKASEGGAMSTSYGTISVWASTFSANTAAVSGATIEDESNGIVQAAADIFDGSCDPSGAWYDQGYNVASDGTCLDNGPGDVNHHASLTGWLGPLGNYGGPTGTMPPVAGSPAISVVPDPEATSLNGVGATLCPTTDQRGDASTPGHACNAGAVQGGGAVFAYATATTSGLSSCPATPVASQECTLAEALSLVAPGGAVYLATAGNYLGNWTVATPGTSSSATVTIEPAPGVTNPTLDGNLGGTSGCQTSSCDGPVLTVGAGVYAQVEGVTFYLGDNTGSGDGGAIYNSGTLVATASTFSNDAANFGGGAIYNDGGSVSVAGSLFAGDSTNYYGGAIYSLDGSVTVSGSAFTGDSASIDGGAIGAIDTGLTVSGSTLWGNGATDGGGAIYTSGGTATVADSTFPGNVASLGYGGAIDNGGALTVVASTFSVYSNPDTGNVVYNGGPSAVMAADIFDGSCQKGSTWQDAGYNVGSDSTCVGAATDVDYHQSLINVLGAPANNGGPNRSTFFGTMLPLTGNPALGLIPNTTPPVAVDLDGSEVTLCPATDQRGDQSTPGEPCDAGAAQVPYTAPPASQAISFTAPTSGVVGGSATLSATGGGSGNPVLFSVDGSSGTGVCNVSGTDGTTVNYAAAGSCVIDANQAGNADYSAAPEVTRTITVSQSSSPPGGGSPPPGGGLPPGPTTTTTTTGATTTTTLAPTTTTTLPPSSPTSVPVPQVSIVSTKAKVVDGDLPVKLSCRVATCSGTVTVILVKGHKTVVLAGAAYKFLGAGRTDVLQLQVTAAGSARFSPGKTVKDRCIATVHGGLPVVKMLLIS